MPITPLRAGIRMFRYQPGFLHQKALLIDDDSAAIGSMNLDSRSFRLNFEVNALVVDGAFAAEVASMLEADFARSLAIDPSANTATRPTCAAWPCTWRGCSIPCCRSACAPCRMIGPSPCPRDHPCAASPSCLPAVRQPALPRAGSLPPSSRVAATAWPDLPLPGVRARRLDRADAAGRWCCSCMAAVSGATTTSASSARACRRG